MPETLMVLLLDPRTQFPFKSLITPIKFAGKMEEAAKQADQISKTITAGNELLLNDHREVFAALNASSGGSTHSTPPEASPSFNLTPSVGSTAVICGAPITPSAQALHHRLSMTKLISFFATGLFSQSTGLGCGASVSGVNASQGRLRGTPVGSSEWYRLLES